MSGLIGETADYVKNLEAKVFLIDGVGLDDFLIEYSLGVSVYANYEI